MAASARALLVAQGILDPYGNPEAGAAVEKLMNSPDPARVICDCNDCVNRLAEYLDAYKANDSL